MKIDLLPRQWFLVVVGVLFVGYVLFQARFLILGPQVSIESPRDGEIVAQSTIILSGKARDAAWISLNDRQIFTDEKGIFSEKLIVSQGLSIITVRVVDRFGREKEKSLRILLN